MYYGISVLIGACIAGMIAMNGLLTAHYGVYSATVAIHITGILLVGLLVAYKAARKQVNMRAIFGMPAICYLGGIAGVGSTVFNNLAFGRISVSAILALALLGQSITACIIDHFGLFYMQKYAFQAKKMVGLLFVLAGIAIMLAGSTGEAIILPVAVSLFAGATVVLSRTLNAALAEKAGPLLSTLANYFVGLLAALLVFFVLGRNEPIFLAQASLLPGILPYCGGLVGVAVVFLFNIAVKKIPSLQMTLLVFIGQIFTGVLLDVLLTNSIAWKNIFGGVFVAVGMAVNAYMEQAAKRNAQ